MTTNARGFRRRTQKERRAATQAILREATLKCLARDGYAHTSISSIIAEAGVSRGALLHHFPTKNELIAAVIVEFYRQRLERFKAKLLGSDPRDFCLEDRLRVLQEDFDTWNALSLEIEGILRNNSEIAQQYQYLIALDNEKMALEYEQLFPEFARTESPRDVIGIVCHLMRGLARESGEDATEKRFQIFASMVKSYLASAEDSRAAGA